MGDQKRIQLEPSIADLLQKQVALEAFACAQYLSMAFWAEHKGYVGSASFLHKQSDEERSHQLKVMKYLSSCQHQALVPSVGSLTHQYSSLRSAFEGALAQEEKVSVAIHKLSDESLRLKDHRTFQFLRWFVEEQQEEEELFRHILSLFELWGEQSPGIGLLDQAIGHLADRSSSKP